MTRSSCLTLLILVGVVTTVAVNEARQDRATLAVQELDDNLFMLANAPSVQGMGGGGNTAIFVASDGVTLVDTKIKGYGPDILSVVRALTDKPITTISNGPLGNGQVPESRISSGRCRAAMATWSPLLQLSTHVLAVGPP